MGLAFCLQLVLTVAITSEKRQDRKIRFYFFAIPSLLAVMAVLTGVFTGTIGPFGRDTPSFVFFISMFNVYTYLLLWGYWPVGTSVMSGKNNVPFHLPPSRLLLHCTLLQGLDFLSVLQHRPRSEVGEPSWFGQKLIFLFGLRTDFFFQ